MESKSKILATYINKLIALNQFLIAEEIDGDYQNMGAIIIDGLLQAGISYATTVKPRVKKFLHRYPNVKTTSQFKELISQLTVSELIDWKPSAKTDRIENLTDFLIGNKVETQEDFKRWLDNQENIKQLKKLSGIKNKTADYFKILTGHEVIAPDRHLFTFLSNAGIDVDNDYRDAQAVISGAARILNIRASYLDHSIWKFISNNPLTPRRATQA